ncbi:MAG: type I restriction enzyme HsdR N-terminal domain-containing protein [Treponema sp.]|jgi:predicted type IV restriction endonuclease|nr:type I restriction enzyme HsdR N-terminal domain-containing protein [Treponema sp.]
MEQENAISKKIFGGGDIHSLVSRKDFTEADVAAVIVEPLLKNLGFSYENIERNKTLKLRAGRKLHTMRPDYLMKVGNAYAWTLETKSPNQNILEKNNIEQAYSYAAHIDVQSNYFTLCNGLEFVCYRTTETNTPKLYFKMSELDKHWNELRTILSINSFQAGKTFAYETRVTAGGGGAVRKN